MSRSNAFKMRVRLEREIVLKINEKYQDRRLHGLSRLAIGSWLNIGSEDAVMTPISDVVADELFLLSRQLKLEADTSRIVFSDDEPNVPSPGLERLDQILNSVEY